MQTEFEATFLSVNKEEIRKRLQSADAELIYPEYLMKRVVFNPAIPEHGVWLRVRQEAEKTTMSVKKVIGDKITDQKEIQLTVDSFENGLAFLIAVGAQQKSYQETKRELWILDDVDITIDTWPGLNPLVEVEGKNEEMVKTVSKKLGFDYASAYFGAVDGVYVKELGIAKGVINNHTPEITFENPPHK